MTICKLPSLAFLFALTVSSAGHASDASFELKNSYALDCELSARHNPSHYLGRIQLNYDAQTEFSRAWSVDSNNEKVIEPSSNSSSAEEEIALPRNKKVGLWDKPNYNANLSVLFEKASGNKRTEILLKYANSGDGQLGAYDYNGVITESSAANGTLDFVVIAGISCREL